MPTRPSVLYRWATAVGAIRAPIDAGVQDSGWVAPGGDPESPILDSENELLNNIFAWLDYLDRQGVTPWITARAYQIGDIVVVDPGTSPTNRYGMFRCKTVHTSATFATDLAANWEEVSGEFVGVRDWATATEYRVGDKVITDAITATIFLQYRCKVAHTSGTFATDLTTKWDEVSLHAIGELRDVSTTGTPSDFDILIWSAAAPNKFLRVDSRVRGYFDCGQLRNAIVNPNGRIFRRRKIQLAAGAGIHFADGEYYNDAWALLQSNAAHTEGDVFYNLANDAIEVFVKAQGGEATQVGIIQLIRFRATLNLLGKSASISFKVAVSSTAQVPNMRAALLAWNSAADTGPRDVVGTWGATPTPVANWTILNTPIDIPVLTTFPATPFVIENIAIPATISGQPVTELALFIWTPAACGDTAAVDIFLKEIQLNGSPRALPFDPPHFIQDLVESQNPAANEFGRDNGQISDFEAVFAGQVNFPFTQEGLINIGKSNGPCHFIPLPGTDSFLISDAVGAGAAADRVIPNTNKIPQRVRAVSLQITATNSFSNAAITYDMPSSVAQRTAVAWDMPSTTGTRLVTVTVVIPVRHYLKTGEAVVRMFKAGAGDANSTAFIVGWWID